MGPILNLSPLGVHSLATGFVWTGSEFGVVWWQVRDETGYPALYFGRISSEGAIVGVPLCLTDGLAGGSSYADVVWTGFEYGIIFIHQEEGAWDAELYFARVSADGVEIGDEAPLTDACYIPYSPRLVWTGAEYGFAWTDRHGEPPVEVHDLWFGQATAAGALIGSPRRICDRNSSGYTSISMIWNGSAYGLAYVADRTPGGLIENDIYFMLLDSDGMALGEEVRVSETLAWSDSPSLAWNGEEFGLAWAWSATRTRDGEAYFARISSDGRLLMPGVGLTPRSTQRKFTDLTWTGLNYGVVWTDNGLDQQLHFARVGGCW
jgi:hypothetical protein